MKKIKPGLLISIVGGILLVLAGVILMLDNFDVIQLNWEMLVGPLFAGGGVIFLAVFILNRENWWALIPGFALIAIGIIIYMGQSSETDVDALGGAVFLGLLGAAFLMIYIFHPDNWWAIIPGGVLMTLAGVTFLDQTYEALVGGVFFAGMAVTFGLVYILPKPAGKLKWALYPAGILLILAILALLNATDLMRYVWPLALLIGGGYLVVRAIGKK